jgi:hypothetical protein
LVAGLHIKFQAARAGSQKLKEELDVWLDESISIEALG